MGGMGMTASDIRYQNTVFLRKKAGGVTEFAKILGRGQPQVSSFAGESPTKGIGNAMARHIERCHQLPEGWMDAPHPELWSDTLLLLKESPSQYLPAATMLSAAILCEISADGAGLCRPASPTGQERRVRCNSQDRDVYAVQYRGERHSPRIRHDELLLIEPNHQAQPGDEVMVYTKDDNVQLLLFLYAKGGRFYFESLTDASLASTTSAAF